MSDFVKRSYSTYFGVNFGNQNTFATPHFEYTTVDTGQMKCLKFGMPMIWNEPMSDLKNCYFLSRIYQSNNKE